MYMGASLYLIGLQNVVKNLFLACNNLREGLFYFIFFCFEALFSTSVLLSI